MGDSQNKGQRASRKMMLGIGLDSDGHKRITTGENFKLIGGTQETHEEMTEKTIKSTKSSPAKAKSLMTSAGRVSRIFAHS
jgi:hypothetical protein